ncbi:DUF1127 domain-containing protein [Agrobacterium vitis]|uniref:YjiS-like domain-containing protein n=2 Tax=Rhizobium/Agrobacterium group TaxID=227290 RepID=B9K1U6_ALLAM|nr:MULTISPECIES: DUF1127 domain-containing protein [Rhizobium/Agrobacterium group]ACM38844.1 conserved hypothetical protein [Allorhizobium ampelinum S4]MCF1433061.1 DUF1127 domain-containing protein [Allorhizobium ampelinum]MCF1446011.1 DUF1127 domain-containing protein [Allorhizobium ampelinum]MCF1490997.1 DUF1127 domain-containing protein [Allorhizobium ampelinum]MUO26457.1 DUF1127 domain-containing protein [Agrobacterium vitis]
MRTTRQITVTAFPHAEGAVIAALRAIVLTVNSVLRTLTNRRAALKLADLDDYLLHDVGLTRAELEAELSKSGPLEDPSAKLAGLARARIRKQVSTLSLG